MPRQLTDDTFEAAVEENDTVLIDFYATWCGPCKILSPVIEEIQQEIGDRALIAKVDVDDAPGLAHRFGVMGVPTVLVLKGGREVKRFVGVQPKATLVSALGV